MPPQTPSDWLREVTDLDSQLRRRLLRPIFPYLRDCGTGIGTGESGGALGAACDLLLSVASAFTPAGPAVNVAQGGRDAVAQTKHFIDGKGSIGAGFVGTVGVLAVMGEVGVAGRAVRLGKRALNAVKGLRDADRMLTARAALETIVKVVNTGEDAVPGLLRVLGDDTGRVADSTKDVLLQVLNKSDDVARTSLELERLATHYGGYENLVQSLERTSLELNALGLLGSVPQGKVLAHLVESLDRINEFSKLGGAPAVFSDEALKGMAVFLAHGLARARPWKRTRLLNMWRDFALLNPATQHAAFENMMRWIGEGEKYKIPGWVDFLSKGPGTLRRASTKGSYAVLQYLSQHLKWQNIVELERGVGRSWPRRWAPGQLQYDRYVDIVVLERGVEAYKEVKSLSRGILDRRFVSQLTFDIGRVLRQVRRVGDAVDFPDLVARLEKHEYVVDGTAATFTDVKRLILETVETVLRKEGAEQYAKHVRINPL